MRGTISGGVLVLGLLVPAVVPALDLVKDGRALVSIVAATDDEATVFAAEEIARYCQEMSGAKIPALVKRKVGGKSVVVGAPYPGAGKEAFKIAVTGSGVTIAAGGPRGALYGAYELLEKLGCGFWSPENEFVPKKKTLSVESSWKVDAKPAFAWRQGGTAFSYDIKYRPKLRINGYMWSYPTPANLGGNEEMVMGQSLAGINCRESLDRLKEVHPDWFAWREAEGAHVPPQMCPLKAEVIGEIVRAIRERYGKNPDHPVYEDIGYCDDGDICECEACRKFAEKHGTSGIIVECANRVARALAKDFPNVRLSVMAYCPTETPPKGLKIEPAITITWASLRNFAVPTKEVPGHDEKLKRWIELANGRVAVWDYNTQFRGFMLPAPIIDMMGPFFRGYRKMGVWGVFVQTAGFAAPIEDFAELRGWLFGRLAWNPDQDEWALIDRWCDGACGKGAPFVKEWLRIGKKARERKRNYGPYDPDSRNTFTLKELVKGYDLLQKALAATEGDTRTNKQVRRLSASPLAAVLCCYDFGIVNAAKSLSVSIPSRDELLKTFEAICREHGVSVFGEGRSLDQFMEVMRTGNLLSE